MMSRILKFETKCDYHLNCLIQRLLGSGSLWEEENPQNLIGRIAEVGEPFWLC